MRVLQMIAMPLLLAAPTAQALQAQQVPSDAATECRYGSWSKPAALPGVSPGVQPRHPAFQIQGEGGVLIATDLRYRDSLTDHTMLERPPWIGVDLASGRAIESPPGNFLVLNPKAQLDSYGSLHVTWAEHDTLHFPVLWSDVEGVTRTTSIWYAKRDGQGQWTNPIKIYEPDQRSDFAWGHEVLWDETDAYASMAVDRKGRVHVTLLSSESTNYEYLVHALIHNGQVRITRLPEERAGIYHAVVPAGDTVYALYTYRFGGPGKPPPGELMPLNVHVFVRRSLDAGETWEPPVPVGRSLEGRISPLRAMLGPDGVLHIVWAQGLELNTRRQVIRHVRLFPQSGEWLESQYLDPRDGFFQLQAAIDECGAIHVVYREHQEEIPQIPNLYARWSGEWSEPIRPFSRFVADEATLATDSGQVVFYGIEITPTRGDWAVWPWEPPLNFQAVTSRMRIIRR